MNFAELSRSSGTPQTTLKRYLALLEQTFLLRRLPAWSRNPSKRLVRSPKLLFCDTGLLSHVAGWTPDRLRGHPQKSGPLLENFVAMELVKQATWALLSCGFSHFRTSAGTKSIHRSFHKFSHINLHRPIYQRILPESHKKQYPLYQPA